MEPGGHLGSVDAQGIYWAVKSILRGKIPRIGLRKNCCPLGRGTWVLKWVMVLRTLRVFRSLGEVVLRVYRAWGRKCALVGVTLPESRPWACGSGRMTWQIVSELAKRLDLSGQREVRELRHRRCLLRQWKIRRLVGGEH